MYRDIKLDKESINKIYNRKIKIEREVNIFEDEDVIINKSIEVSKVLDKEYAKILVKWK